MDKCVNIPPLRSATYNARNLLKPINFQHPLNKDWHIYQNSLSNYYRLNISCFEKVTRDKF